ncbi:MAG TPA: hypothetical protein PKE29_09105 [Phycisphaerales bacterium]|nr:hypothetical protein [Phycisphaerales bacterium]
MSLRIGMPLAAIAVALSAGAAQAVFVIGNGQQVNLAAVLNSNDRQFQIGDKLFTILTYTSDTLPAANVSVTGFISANPLDGIGFDLTGGFGDVPGNNVISDIVLRYTVEVTEPQLGQGIRIKDTALVFNGSSVGSGSYARVDESILDFFGQPGNNLLGTRQVFDIAGPPQQTQLQDYQEFADGASYAKLEIIKDIQFFAFGPNGQASASFVRQAFSQTPTPGGSMLVALGGLILVRRRR